MNGFLGPEKFAEAANIVEDLPKPSAKSGEVLIRVTVRPLNPADIFSLMGVYPGFQPKKFPAVPGLEGFGVVEAVGEGVSKVKAGQRVIPILGEYMEEGQGSWQEYVVVKEQFVVPVPDSVSDEAAAQFLVNPVTVVGMLEVLNAPKGEYVLQTAAGSVLGRMFISVAKHRGLKTINIVRRSAQKEELKEIGADEVICSSEEDIVSRVKEITKGKGAYGAIECIAGDMIGKVVSSVRDGGEVLLYGSMGGLTFQANVPDVLFRGIVIKGFWLSLFLKSLSTEKSEKLFSEVMNLLETKIIEPFVGEKMDLSLFKEALQKQGVEGRGGKILLIG